MTFRKGDNKGKRVYDPEKHCGGKRHQDKQPCTNYKGHKTDHPGQGRCKFHGGCVPITHGRNSIIQRESIRDRIKQLQEVDKNPYDLEPDLFLMRALMIDYIERYDEFSHALIAWWESWKTSFGDYKKAFYRFKEANKKKDLQGMQEALNDISVIIEEKDTNSRPHQILDLAEATNIIEKISRVIERIHKIKSMHTITEGDYIKGMKLMGLAVRKHVDEETAELIAKEWDDISNGIFVTSN